MDQRETDGVRMLKSQATKGYLIIVDAVTSRDNDSVIVGANPNVRAGDDHTLLVGVRTLVYNDNITTFVKSVVNAIEPRDEVAIGDTRSIC